MVPQMVFHLMVLTSFIALILKHSMLSNCLTCLPYLWLISWSKMESSSLSFKIWYKLIDTGFLFDSSSLPTAGSIFLINEQSWIGLSGYSDEQSPLMTEFRKRVQFISGNYRSRNRVIDSEKYTENGYGKKCYINSMKALYRSISICRWLFWIELRIEKYWESSFFWLESSVPRNTVISYS